MLMITSDNDCILKNSFGSVKEKFRPKPMSNSSYVNHMEKYPLNTDGFAERLQRLCDKKKLTKAALADRMGKANQGSVTGWFQGSIPRGDQLYLLAHIVDPGAGPWNTLRYLLAGDSNVLLSDNLVTQDKINIDSVSPPGENVPSDETQTGEGSEMGETVMVEMLKTVNLSLQGIEARISRMEKTYEPHFLEFHKDLRNFSQRLTSLDTRLTAMEQQQAWRNGQPKKG